MFGFSFIIFIKSGNLGSAIAKVNLELITKGSCFHPRAKTKVLFECEAIEGVQIASETGSQQLKKLMSRMPHQHNKNVFELGKERYTYYIKTAYNGSTAALSVFIQNNRTGKAKQIETLTALDDHTSTEGIIKGDLLKTVQEKYGERANEFKNSLQYSYHIYHNVAIIFAFDEDGHVEKWIIYNDKKL